MKKDVIINTKAISELKNGEIKSLQDSKVDKEVINLVITKLDKIENLLLDHMKTK